MPNIIIRDGDGIDSTYSGYYQDTHSGAGDVAFGPDGIIEIDVTTKLSLLVHAEGISGDRNVIVSVKAHPDSEWVEFATGTATNGVMAKICGEIVRGYAIKINLDGDAKIAVALKS